MLLLVHVPCFGKLLTHQSVCGTHRALLWAGRSVSIGSSSLVWAKFIFPFLSLEVEMLLHVSVPAPLPLWVTKGPLEQETCHTLFTPSLSLSSGSASCPSDTCQPQHAPLATGLAHPGGAHGFHGYRPGLSHIQDIDGYSRGWRSGQ